MEIDIPIATNGCINGNKDGDLDMPDATNGSVNGKKDKDFDISVATNGSINGKKDNNLDLYPVAVNISGEGLPYAPINWPKPGDIWTWRTGRRIAASGHHLDRYLYLPARFQTSKRRKYGLASKQAVEHYVRSEFPNTDVKAFFDLFSWKIPCSSSDSTKDDNEDVPVIWEATESKISDSHDGEPACKARNKLCTSLVLNDSSTQLMACDICCVEPGFCRDCCCILCCQAISTAHGGYSYFRCAALVTDTICGHVAHINCALRAHLAGTVGRTIALDAEYYCRRCDSRSDLVPHVIKLLQTCKSIVSREQIEEILGVGMCILRDAQRANAKQLLHNIQLAIGKLKDGTDLEEVWKMESVPAITAGGQAKGEYEGLPPLLFSSSHDHSFESLALDDEIELTLQELKNSQESEYKIAAEALIAQKKYIQSLYQRLDHEKSHLSRHASSVNAEAMLQTVIGRMEQVKGEVAKFNDMKEVAKGFGRTPKRILEEHFGMDTEN